MDLSKLTVPALKALCKERKLVGYSKLGKKALLEKLAGAPASTTAPAAGGTSSDASRVPETPTAALVENSGTPDPAPAPSSSSNSIRAPPVDTVQEARAPPRPVIPTSTSNPQLAPRSIYENMATEDRRALQYNMLPPLAPALSPWSLPAAKSDDIEIPMKKPTKNYRSIIDGSSPTGTQALKPSLLAPSRATGEPPSAPRSDLTTSASDSSSTLQVPSTIIRSSGTDRVFPTPAPRPKPSSVSENIPLSKRLKTTHIFKPPPPTRASALKPPIRTSFAPAKAFNPLAIRSLPNSALNLPSVRSLPKTASRSVVNVNGLLHFDFQPYPPVTLADVTMPPSLSRRKLIARMTIILSGLEDPDRRACVLVCRAWRYAIYLSAHHILLKSFSGKRLARLFAQRSISPNQTNLWPYLKQRMREAEERRGVYYASFLRKFSSSILISKRLWTSPDHEQQIVVAIRFVITRLYFSLALGKTRGSKWLSATVIDAQKVVGDEEIWSVTIMSTELGKPYTETYYILAPTGEVLGRPVDASRPCSGNDSFTGADTIPLRGDWSGYISTRLLPASLHDRPPGTLLDHVKWLNGEEFLHGISRHWLKRVESEGEVGRVKKKVAERYVLAHVVDRSVSGSYKTAMQMAQDFAGLASEMPVVGKKQKSHDVNLYIPPHHYVESVHFTTSSGTPLHPAVAIVQTQTREHIILRDTGFEIGCEEDGVLSLWRDMVECDEQGVALGMPE
ncbi:hypothetical protein BOTBODRAFT_498998 [Botryobasidium botryosum FD-172 SS1]|uniref:Rho termination factor N-terminal domain-containing protein n=1 Tax=Botryobasidium botryosum (strain FD-172 SS1) TaxID=930990 RepID=A0A067M3L9_BOTB1|nr:hypothetical protein BOTBODRAFT_498998 [Botryobasidium botryosum FD-172 SS1]